MGNTPRRLKWYGDLSKLPSELGWSNADEADRLKWFDELEDVSSEGYGTSSEIRRMARKGRKIFGLKVFRDRFYVLKVLKDGQSMLRLAREVNILSRLNHPNIVKIVGYGVVKNQIRYTVLTNSPSYLMNFVDGKSLFNMENSEIEELGLEGKLKVTEGIASALKHIHKCRMVYVDINLGNVILCRGDKTPVLCDFGGAFLWREGDKVNGNELLYGTPEFMSPEHALGQRLDPKSDIYSLGAFMYRLVYGKNPFNGELQEILKAHVNSPLEIPRRADVPCKVGEIIGKAMEKGPMNRYLTMNDMLLDIRACRQTLQ